MASSSFVPLILLCAISSAAAFNITTLLSPFPSFSSFNDLLSFTNLSQEISTRNSVTLLAVNNAAVTDIAARPIAAVKRILSLHLLLDYYDEAKLRTLVSTANSTTSPLLVTLFQASGTASGQMGFLKVAATTPRGGDIVFSSAVDGSTTRGSKFVKQIVAKPYNISILQIDAVVVPPGVTTAASDFASPPENSPPRPHHRRRDTTAGPSLPPTAAGVPPPYVSPPLAAASPALLGEADDAAEKDGAVPSPSPAHGVSSGAPAILLPFRLFLAAVLCVPTAAAIFF